MNKARCLAEAYEWHERPALGIAKQIHRFVQDDK